MADPTRPTPTTDRPLCGWRVVELHAERLPGCGRLLADLGAEVVLVEPPGGIAERRAEPRVAGHSLPFEVHHANKRSVVLDLADAADRRRFEALLGSAQLLIESLPPGRLAALGLAPDRLRERHPRLTVLSISDYGQTGPRSRQVATEHVIAATSGLLCRSGLPGRAPLMPPAGLVLESTAVQAAWVALLALWQAAHTGVGDWLDFSIQEGAAQVLDPALGITGSASAGRSALDTTPHGRPPVMPLYPVIPCRDGQVRLCVLNPRQWEAMRDWLGTDHPFTDPKFANIAHRLQAAEALNACIGQRFALHDAAELVAEGRRRGVPVAALVAPAAVLEDAHFAARRAFVPLDLGAAAPGALASGYWEIDGQRTGWQRRAPAADADRDLLGTAAAGWPVPGPIPLPPAPDRPGWLRRPLQGVRVLDLGVIVAGAEAGRLLADQGADVIKVESRAFPDGGRQSMTGDRMTPSIAQGHRNKRSFGLNLRSPAGKALFLQLAAEADVVLSNFKPGTLDSLGLGNTVLLEANPRLVLMNSSALGSTGPLSRSLGYGPLVRAATGLSSLWRYPGEPGAYCDGVTVYPDHLAARVATVGVVALLLRRLRTGRGGVVSLSQAEVFLNAAAVQFLRESLQPGSLRPQGNHGEFRAPEGVYPCAGDDQWCAVSVRDDADWQRLVAAIDRPDLAADAGLAEAAGRLARRDEVEAALQAFTAQRSPQDVETRLQAAGVPAGAMLRLSEFRGDPHFRARGFIAEMTHPAIEGTLPTEHRIALSEHMPVSELRAAPFQGEHTREIAASLLGLPAERIEALMASGDLEDHEAPDRR